MIVVHSNNFLKFALCITLLVNTVKNDTNYFSPAIYSKSGNCREAKFSRNTNFINFQVLHFSRVR